MRFIDQRPPRLTLYAWEDNGHFMLSPFAEARGSWRPIQIYASREELEQDVLDKRNDVVWLS